MKAIGGIVVAVALVVTTAPASARKHRNGAQLNDGSLNGSMINGAQLNDGSLNGSMINGVQINGTRDQGTSLTGVARGGVRIQGLRAERGQLVGIAIVPARTHHRAARR